VNQKLTTNSVLHTMEMRLTWPVCDLITLPVVCILTKRRLVVSFCNYYCK